MLLNPDKKESWYNSINKQQKRLKANTISGIKESYFKMIKDSMSRMI